MHVDEHEAEIVAKLPGIPVAVAKEEMAQVKIAVIHAGRVKLAGDFGNARNKGALQRNALPRWKRMPAFGELLERDHAIHRLGDDTGFEASGIQAAQAFAGESQGGNAGALGIFNRAPLRAGADNRQSAVRKILNDFTPTAAALRFDKIAFAIELELDRAPVFDLSVHGSLKREKVIEHAAGWQRAQDVGIQLDHTDSGTADASGFKPARRLTQQIKIKSKIKIKKSGFGLVCLSSGIVCSFLMEQEGAGCYEQRPDAYANVPELCGWRLGWRNLGQDLP